MLAVILCRANNLITPLKYLLEDAALLVKDQWKLPERARPSSVPNDCLSSGAMPGVQSRAVDKS